MIVTSFGITSFGSWEDHDKFWNGVRRSLETTATLKIDIGWDTKLYSPGAILPGNGDRFLSCDITQNGRWQRWTYDYRPWGMPERAGWFYNQLDIRTPEEVNRDSQA